MNKLPKNLITGTAGELLVQLRLFQFGVQAAPPLKDTGNDLIAVKGNQFRAVQVKTTGNEDNNWSKTGLDREFHILALVRLRGGAEYELDRSDVYLYDKSEVVGGQWNDLAEHRISRPLIERLFQE